jgi:hypothetical protein
MTTWKVEKANTPIPDTVEADHRRVHRNGELEFYDTSQPGSPGGRTWDTVVKLYAPGRWLEVTLDPATRCTDSLCVYQGELVSQSHVHTNQRHA